MISPSIQLSFNNNVYVHNQGVLNTLIWLVQLLKQLTQSIYWIG